MEIEKEIPKYKIVFLGDQNVGKTSIINRFANDIFEEECQSTIGLDFTTKNAKINNKDINLLLYDIGGKEKFRSLIPLYTKDSNICLIIYDITNKDSFINIGDRLNDLSNNEDYIPVLIGNKKDLENDRAVTKKEGEDFAKEKGFIFSEVSSKTGEGIEDLFYKKIFPAMIKKYNIGLEDVKEESDNGNNVLIKEKPVKIITALNKESNKEEEAGQDIIKNIFIKEKPIKILSKLDEENNKEEDEQNNGNNLEIDNKFNIGNREKDSMEIINDLINQNNKVKLDENIMIDPKNKCYSKGHEEIMPNYYCPQCKIYMCKKCEISHSNLFYQKNHILINLDKDKDKEINDIFTGYCKENNHLEKLEYFCKTHNKLCCSSCIVKIKREGKGQHTDCDICLIENIKDEKNKIFKKNIEILEELSNNINKIINELKDMFKTIKKNKDELKLKIQNIFTEIRTKINEREDMILLEVDQIYDNTYVKDNAIKIIDNLPNKIKSSLEKGKLTEEEWQDKNKLSSIIHECVNIEKNIISINLINNIIKQSKNNMKTKIKFYPEEKNDINKILSNLFNFGKVYKEKSLDDIYENPILEVEISSINEISQNCFSFELNGFSKEKYYKYYPEQIKYKDNEMIITICLEGKNEESINSLFEFFHELLSKEVEGYPLKFSLRKDKNKIYVEFLRPYKEKELDDIFVNINEFIEISVMFRNNFKIGEFLDMSFDKFFMSFLSIIFSMKIKAKNLQKLLLFIENNKNKINGKEKDFLIVIVHGIISLINSKIEINFTPNKILQIIKKNSQDNYLNGDMKILRKEIEELLKDLNQNKLKGILNHLKLEKFIVNILFSKYKSGFSLEINTSGLTSVVDKLVLSNGS